MLDVDAPARRREAAAATDGWSLVIGSSTASIESAMRLMATTSEAIASAANSTSHQYPAPQALP